MLKRMMLLFAGVPLGLCGAAEFSAGTYSMRSADVYAELENLSRTGKLGGGTFSRGAWSNASSPIRRRGGIERFMFRKIDSSFVLEADVVPAENPLREAETANLRGNVVFDLKTKAVLSCGFAETEDFWGRGDVPAAEEVESRNVNVTEWLLADPGFFFPPGLSACFDADRVLAERWERIVSEFNVFRFVVFSGKTALTISFDKDETAEFTFVKSLARKNARVLSSFDERAADGEFVVELQRDTGKFSRRIVRLAVRRACVPASLCAKYPNLKE